MIGLAETGSGKTAAFALPVLHDLLATKGKKEFFALVLAPTRLVICICAVPVLDAPCVCVCACVPGIVFCLSHILCCE